MIPGNSERFDYPYCHGLWWVLNLFGPRWVVVRLADLGPKGYMAVELTQEGHEKPGKIHVNYKPGDSAFEKIEWVRIVPPGYIRPSISDKYVRVV